MTRFHTFTFRNSPIRIAMSEGHPWFIGADVWTAVEGPSDIVEVLKRLTTSEKRSATIFHPGGTTQTTLVSQGGLTALMAPVRTPLAVDFMNWIACRVSPILNRWPYAPRTHGEPWIVAIEGPEMREAYLGQDDRQMRRRRRWVERWIVRLLLDLMHLADGEDLDFRRLLKSALRSYHCDVLFN